MQYIEIRYLHISAYTFEVVGVGQFPGLWIYLHGIRYVHLIELIFGFPMVFILCQSDIY